MVFWKPQSYSLKPPISNSASYWICQQKINWKLQTGKGKAYQQLLNKVKNNFF